MAWSPDYITADDLKSFLRINDADDDTELAVAITAASRAIDAACGRQFGSVSPAAARVYTWDERRIEGRPALEIDDLSSTSNLAVALDLNYDGTFEQTITLNTDFDLFPWNAASNDRPWTHLVLRPTSVAYLPCTARGVQVTGLWGWEAVPDVVTQATLLQAARFFARRNAPFGVAGSPDLGNELRLLARLDPDVDVLVQTVKRNWGAV